MQNNDIAWKLTSELEFQITCWFFNLDLNFPDQKKLCEAARNLESEFETAMRYHGYRLRAFTG